LPWDLLQSRTFNNLRHHSSRYRYQRRVRRTHRVTGPGYDVLVGAHVLSAVIGFGSVGVSGAYAARARSSPSPREDVTVLRYFHPGKNWAERALLVTPVLGAVLLFAGDRGAVSEAWPWIGLGAWAVAAALVSAWCWPAERRVQAWLADAGAGAGATDDPGATDGGPGATDDDPGATDLAGFRAACKAVQWSASAISVCFTVAVVVMVGQPH